MKSRGMERKLPCSMKMLAVDDSWICGNRDGVAPRLQARRDLLGKWYQIVHGEWNGPDELSLFRLDACQRSYCRDAVYPI